MPWQAHADSLVLLLDFSKGLSVKPNLIVIRSLDIDMLAEFYSLLGCNFEKHSHGKGPEHYAHEFDGAVFEIYPIKKGGPATVSVRIGFLVGSVDDTVKRMVKSGKGKLVSEPKDSPWGRRAVIDDPDGHRVELVQKSG